MDRDVLTITIYRSDGPVPCTEVACPERASVRLRNDDGSAEMFCFDHSVQRALQLQRLRDKGEPDE